MVSEDTRRPIVCLAVAGTATSSRIPISPRPTPAYRPFRFFAHCFFIFFISVLGLMTKGVTWRFGSCSQLP